jgi:hypothetical protein
MIISEQLRKTNIAEYIIYMWQTEDMVRSLDYDIDKIQLQIIDKYDTDTKTKQNIKKWYLGIIRMSELENIKKSGHLQVITNLVNDLNELHVWLLNQPEEISYKIKYETALPAIRDLSSKMKNAPENDIDICLHGLYAIMLLKMKNIELSKATQSAIETFRDLISVLAFKYKEREENPDKYYS